MTDQVQVFLVLIILLKIGISNVRNVFPSSSQPSPKITDKIRHQQTMLEVDITRIRQAHGAKARKTCIVFLTRQFND
jgi:hypothetical protein